METLVLSAEDCPKDGWRKGSGPEVFAWQGDEYSYWSNLGRTSLDLSEQMHSISGCYMPPDILPCGSHSITEKHFYFLTSVIESGRSRCSNNIEYLAAPTWHYSSASSQMNHQSKDIHWGIHGCRSVSALRGWTFTKAKNYEITGQAFCRYSSRCLVSRKFLQEVFPNRHELPVCRSTPMARVSSLELLTREIPSTNSLQRSKTNICARGVVYTEDETPQSMCCELMHNRLANKPPQSGERVGCNMPRIASPEPYQIISVGTNCMKKGGKESSASINGAPLDRIKGGQEWECSSMNKSEGKAMLCHSSPRSKRDIYKDHCDGLMPFESVVTSAFCTPLATKGYSQEGSQSAHSPPMKERWAGPGFSNSPPPSSLPVPTFTRRQLRTSSLEIRRAEAEFLADSICVSAPGTPSRSFSLPSIGAILSHLDTNDATLSLRRLLNLDFHT